MNPIMKSIIRGHAKMSRKGRYASRPEALFPCASNNPAASAKMSRAAPPTHFHVKALVCLSLFIAVHRILFLSQAAHSGQKTSSASRILIGPQAPMRRSSSRRNFRSETRP